MLNPPLIIHLHYFNSRLNSVQSAPKNQHRLCWCALIVSGMLCFPGVTSSTVSPGLVSKNPGRAPRNARFHVVSHSCPGVRLGCQLCAGRSRGFVALLCRPRFIFSDALSAGDTVSWLRPTGSLTARVFYNGGSAPLQVSTRLSLSLVSSSLPGLSQLELRTLTVICPFHHPSVFFSIQTEAISTPLTRLFSGSWQGNSHISLHAHTESYILSFRSHPSVAS